MNANNPTKSRGRRLSKATLSENNNNESQMIFSPIFNSRDYRDALSKEPADQVVLDLSVKKDEKTKFCESKINEDEDKSHIDSEEKCNQLFLQPFSLINQNHIKSLQNPNDMSFLWNFLMQFSFNNYHNYLNQLKLQKNISNEDLDKRI
jgi:hypothetical protein